jgi:hypothetical protein
MSATQIVILGMHRSGTSAIAGLLNSMGLYFGSEQDAVPAIPSNERGFWERKDVVKANDALLADQGCKWDYVRSFDAAQVSAGARGVFHAEAARILAEMDAHAAWFIKDPRLCLTFPLWRPLLKAPICLLVFRNPLQVARSLRARLDCSTHTGIALWEKHVLSSLEVSRTLPRLSAGYEDFLSDPVSNARRLFDSLSALGATGLTLPADPAIRGWLDDGLFHQRAREDESKHHLNEPQRCLYEALKDGSALGWKTIPPMSPPGIEALENHEQEDLRLRNSLVECQQARSHLQNREKYLMDIARQIGECANEMDPCLNELPKDDQLQLRGPLNRLKQLARRAVARAPKSAEPR